MTRWRRLLPDRGDLAALGGLVLLVHVLATLSWLLGEAFVGLVLLLIGMARLGWLPRRGGADD